MGTRCKVCGKGIGLFTGDSKSTICNRCDKQLQSTQKAVAQRLLDQSASQQIVDRIACPKCGSEQRATIPEVEQATPDLIEGYTQQKCAACQHSWLLPGPKHKNIFGLFWALILVLAGLGILVMRAIEVLNPPRNPYQAATSDSNDVTLTAVLIGFGATLVTIGIRSMVRRLRAL